MNETTEQKLVRLFPIILKDVGGDPSKTCMSKGLDIPEEWYDIIFECLSEMQVLADKLEVVIIADQIKQKIGELRFSYSVFGEEKGVKDAKMLLEDVVNIAELKSRTAV